MDRKNFIASMITAGALLSGAEAWSADKSLDSNAKTKVPPFLNIGDKIGITSPAGYISLEAIQPSVQLIQSWGYQVEVGHTIGTRDFTFGGTDEERLTDLQQMLDNTELKAIFCARGGYGLIRILDQLNFDKFLRHPKWLVGFSDITAIHCHLNQVYNVASLHSKMCNSFPDDWSKAEPIQISTILSIRQALAGENFSYSVIPSVFNKVGKAEGILIGGNLTMVETLLGTVSDLDTKGKILFLEDTGEYLYSIDRMFWHLKRMGKLSNLAGLVIGGFKVTPDDPGSEFGMSVYEIILQKVEEYQYPVCFDFPVGHQKNNFALKCGLKHILNVQTAACSLQSL
jgi:muramoyltetrapeptide carboxypeptidase